MDEAQRAQRFLTLEANPRGACTHRTLSTDALASLSNQANSIKQGGRHWGSCDVKAPKAYTNPSAKTDDVCLSTGVDHEVAWCHFSSFCSRCHYDR